MRLWFLIVASLGNYFIISEAELIDVMKKDSLIRGRTYRAAVVEHQPQAEGDTPLHTMLANVRIYAKNAALAAQQGVQLIVYPEYGITGLNIGSRSTANQFAQDVPNPKDIQWNACKEPEKFKGKSKIIQELSCIALNNSIVIVANLITRVACTSTTSDCPEDNQFLFNTNIIFSSNGSILACYHKHHLFMEDYLNPSPQPEFVIVDLGFVRLGTFVCFDIMFEDPAIQLIEKYGVKNIAFPTAWVDMYPNFSSIQIFGGFAYALGVNLLAADVYYPKGGSLGSGIYSSVSGALSETYDLATPGRMLIANVPIDPEAVEFPFTDKPKKSFSQLQQDTSLTYLTDSLPKSDFVDVPSSKPVGKIHQILYEDFTNTSYQFLSEKQGFKHVCQKDICCSFDYSFSNKTQSDVYALVVMSGSVGIETLFYIEMCSVVRCNTRDIKSCGEIPEKATWGQFQYFLLSGNFTTNYIYPSILSTKLQHLWPSVWKGSKDCPFYSRTLGLLKPTEDSIFAATLLGRKYATLNHNSGNKI